MPRTRSSKDSSKKATPKKAIPTKASTKRAIPKMATPKQVARAVRASWAESGLRGRMYCRCVAGFYRNVWIVHHGGNGVEGSERAAQRFMKQCRRELGKLGVSPKAMLFELVYSSPGVVDHYRRAFSLGALLADAIQLADQVPKKEWPKGGKWIPVCGTGDAVEMWDKRVERLGPYYRVVMGSYSSWNIGASYSEHVAYVGGRRGAMKYAGFR